MTANHGYYGTRTPKELSVVGDADGFDWITVTEGQFSPDLIIETKLRMTNQGGTTGNWTSFRMESSGIRSTSHTILVPGLLISKSKQQVASTSSKS